MGVMVVRRVAARATVRMEISMMRDGNGFWLRGCKGKTVRAWRECPHLGIEIWGT
jgi:hypothetical protein